MSEEITTTETTSSRRKFLTGTAAAGAGVWAAPAILEVGRASAQVTPEPGCRPATLFTDNFDADNGGNAQLNYANFINWDVTDGSVDLIGNGTFDFYPGNGLYVDLDGSTSNSGVFTTKQAFDFAAGCSYELRYVISGNARNSGTDTVTVKVDAGVATTTHVLPGNQGPTAYTLPFTPGADLTSTISFENAGGDNVGILLFEVTLACV